MRSPGAGSPCGLPAGLPGRICRSRSFKCTLYNPRGDEARRRIHSPNPMGSVPLDTETLLSAYAQGAFPMTDSDGVTRWYTADPRGVIPLEPGRFKIPRSLRQTIRRGLYEIRFNHDFEATMHGCMQGRPEGTWISRDLVKAYVRLHREGFARSVDAWLEGELAGGLYGVSRGGVVFG